MEYRILPQSQWLPERLNPAQARHSPPRWDARAPAAAPASRGSPALNAQTPGCPVGRNRHAQKRTALLCGGCKTQGSDATPVENNHFARLDIAEIGGVDQIKCAGFRSQNVGVVQPPQAQGTKSAWVADAVNAVFEKCHQRVGTLHTVQGVGQRFRNPRLPGSGEEVQNYFRIAGGLKNVAFAF